MTVDRIRKGMLKVITFLPGDTLIRAFDGDEVQIQDIVEKRIPLKVLAYDTIQERFCCEEVVGWFKKPTPKDTWLKLKVGKYRQEGSRSLTIGKENELMSQRGKLSAIEISSSDMVFHLGYSLSEAGKSAVKGIYLGDGSYDPKNGNFTISHGGPQKEYLEFIAQKFISNLSNSTQNKGYGAGFLSYRTSFSIKTLMDESVLCNPKVNDEILQGLGPIGLAFWYMDDGNLQQDTRFPDYSRVQLHTEGFNELECKCISKYFSVCHDINARFYKRNNTRGKTCRLDDKGSEKFLDVVAPFVHPSMRYKLPDQYTRVPFVLDGYKFIVKNVKLKRTYPKLLTELNPSKRNLKIYNTGYGIIVGNRSTFFANNFLVTG